MIKDKCKSKGEKPLQISDMGGGLHLPTPLRHVCFGLNIRPSRPTCCNI